MERHAKSYETSDDMSNFSVGFRTEAHIRILDLNGELDAHTASELEAALQKCRQDEMYRIVANGRHLKYISSAGLGVFMAYIEEMREAGGDIKIAGLQASIFNIFDLLGFPLLFDIVEDEREAIRKFDANPDENTT